jgi:hypothetical protein
MNADSGIAPQAQWWSIFSIRQTGERRSPYAGQAGTPWQTSTEPMSEDDEDARTDLAHSRFDPRSSFLIGVHLRSTFLSASMTEARMARR